MSERLDQTAIANELQEELRDLLCLAVVGDHVRWVLTGEEVAVLAQWLVDSVAQWRVWADQVATRLVGLGVVPDGRVRSLAKDIPFNWVPDGWLDLDEARQLVGERLSRVVGWAQTRSSQVSDPETDRLFGSVYAGLEAQAADFHEQLST
jgi:starvation-inducible DNA-binding protein